MTSKINKNDLTVVQLCSWFCVFLRASPVHSCIGVRLVDPWPVQKKFVLYMFYCLLPYSHSYGSQIICHKNSLLANVEEKWKKEKVTSTSAASSSTWNYTFSSLVAKNQNLSVERSPLPRKHSFIVDTISNTLESWNSSLPFLLLSLRWVYSSDKILLVASVYGRRIFKFKWSWCCTKDLYLNRLILIYTLMAFSQIMDY